MAKEALFTTPGKNMALHKNKRGIIKKPTFSDVYCMRCGYGVKDKRLNWKGDDVETYWDCRRPEDSSEPCPYAEDVADYKAYLKAHPEEKALVATTFRKFMCNFSGILCGFFATALMKHSNWMIIFSVPFFVYVARYKWKNRVFLWKAWWGTRLWRLIDIYYLFLVGSVYVQMLMENILRIF